MPMCVFMLAELCVSAEWQSDKLEDEALCSGSDGLC